MTEPTDDQVLDDVAERWAVQGVLAVLEEPTASPPPTGLRAAVLARAAVTPRRGVDPVDPADLYVGRVAALRLLLDSLSPADWARPVPPYTWTVHGLVAHLLVIERYTASHFGIDAGEVDGVDEHDGDHLAIGAATITGELQREPEVTAMAWATAARKVCDHVRSAGYSADAPAPLHGWPFSQSSALVARAFELWTHADDIRRAIGVGSEQPSAGELRTMSSFSVSGLPFLVQLQHPQVGMVPVRVVLTGAGGGTYDIGGAGAPVATLAADVIDYCRVVARRLEPKALPSTREGDREILNVLLASASAFAV